jgi:ubiquinone/menaquinone biosynthesis C-methylase UbiE
MGFYTTEKENKEYYDQYPVNNKGKFQRRYKLDVLNDPYFLKYATRRINFVLDNGLKKNAVVLDLGCGTGIYGELLTKKRPDITIINSDISQTFLTINRGSLKFQSDSKKIPLKDNAVDYVLCFELFHHVPCLEATLDELRRVVREGIFVNEVNSNNPLCLTWHIIQKDERRLLSNNFFRLRGSIRKRFSMAFFRYFEYIPYFRPILNRYTFDFLYTYLELLTKFPVLKYFSGNYFMYCKKDNNTN